MVRLHVNRFKQRNIHEDELALKKKIFHRCLSGFTGENGRVSRPEERVLTPVCGYSMIAGTLGCVTGFCSHGKLKVSKVSKVTKVS